VLVRGLATPLEESERQAIAEVAPTPLVPSPGDMIFVVRLDVVTGRRFPLGGSTSDLGVTRSGSVHLSPT
jgi:hypothetical protein